MSDTKYWRVRAEVEQMFTEKSTMHYKEIIENLGSVSDVFYAGIIIHELTINGKIGWDSARNLRLWEKQRMMHDPNAHVWISRESFETLKQCCEENHRKLEAIKKIIGKFIAYEAGGEMWDAPYYCEWLEEIQTILESSELGENSENKKGS